MKTILTTVVLLFLTTHIYSQQLSQVTFSGGANLSYFSFLVDNDVLIRVSEDGKVIEWGNEVMAQRSNYYAPKLQPYMGRVEYYGPGSDSAFIGKVKNIGTCTITYYGHYEKGTRAGNLRSLGSVILDYYSDYDQAAFKGKLKMIGTLMLEHYPSTVDESYRNKLKSIGNTTITYYSSFDDKLIKGKIKTIGPVTYTWYTSFDLRGGGGLKTGLYRQNIGGVTYILQ